MFKSIFQLFKIARKLASSGAVETINEIYKIPFVIKLFFDLFAIGSKKISSSFWNFKLTDFPKIRIKHETSLEFYNFGKPKN